MPGIKPNNVRKILINKAEPNPTVKKTPRGGNMILVIIFKSFMVSKDNLDDFMQILGLPK
jgi:hypothetical protein